MTSINMYQVHSHLIIIPIGILDPPAIICESFEYTGWDGVYLATIPIESLLPGMHRLLKGGGFIIGWPIRSTGHTNTAGREERLYWPGWNTGVLFPK